MQHSRATPIPTARSTDDANRDGRRLRTPRGSHRHRRRRRQRENPDWEDELYDAGHALLKERGGGLLHLQDRRGCRTTRRGSLGTCGCRTRSWCFPTSSVGHTCPLHRCHGHARPDAAAQHGTEAPIYWVEMGWDALITDLDVEDGDPDGDTLMPLPDPVLPIGGLPDLPARPLEGSPSRRPRGPVYKRRTCEDNRAYLTVPFTIPGDLTRHDGADVASRPGLLDRAAHGQRRPARRGLAPERRDAQRVADRSTCGASMADLSDDSNDSDSDGRLRIPRTSTTTRSTTRTTARR